MSDFPEDEFLSEIPGGNINVSDIFASFTSIDTDCVFDILAAFDEPNDAPTCRSNNIAVNLSDDISLLPINTSCIGGDSVEAYPFQSYSPLELLAAFQGDDLNGTWTLTVTDSETGDTGVLNSWGIVFNIDR